MPCSPGMRRCKASCAHRALVKDYRTERDRQEARLDAETLGYATEREDVLARRPELRPVNFQQWLVQTAGSGAEEAVA